MGRGALTQGGVSQLKGDGLEAVNGVLQAKRERRVAPKRVNTPATMTCVLLEGFSHGDFPSSRQEGK